MNNTLKFILVLIGSGIVMFLIFYFYPAEIFDAKVIGKDGGEVATSLSLKAWFEMGELPEKINPQNVEAIKRQLSGWVIMFICLVGLPLMLAYRSIVTKKDQKTEE